MEKMRFSNTPKKGPHANDIMQLQYSNYTVTLLAQVLKCSSAQVFRHNMQRLRPEIEANVFLKVIVSRPPDAPYAPSTPWT